MTTQTAYHVHDNYEHRDLEIARTDRDNGAIRETPANADTAREWPTGFIARLTDRTKAQWGWLAKRSAQPYVSGQGVTLQVDAGFLDRIRSGGVCFENPKNETPEYKRWRELVRARVRKAIESVRRQHTGRQLRLRLRARLYLVSSARHSRSSRRTTRVARSVAKKVTSDPDEPRLADPGRGTRFHTYAHHAEKSFSPSTIGGAP